MAVATLTANSTLAPLYRRAVKSYGEGTLHVGILKLVVDALQEKSLEEEVLGDDASLLAFVYGVWIQFLLTEIAGVEKEHLGQLVEKTLADRGARRKSLH